MSKDVVKQVAALAKENTSLTKLVAKLQAQAAKSEGKKAAKSEKAEKPAKADKKAKKAE